MSHSINVVLANYNDHNLIEKSIPSIVKATDHFEYEIIIIDDYSTHDNVKFLFTWRHLKGFYNWLLRILFTLLKLMARRIILDWKCHAAFFQGFSRRFTFP